MRNSVRVFDLSSALFPSAPFTEFFGFGLGTLASRIDVVSLRTIRVDVILVVRVKERGVVLIYFAHLVYLVADGGLTQTLSVSLCSRRRVPISVPTESK